MKKKSHIVHFKLPSGLVVSAVIKATSKEEAISFFLESFKEPQDLDYAKKNIIRVDDE